MNKLFAFIIGSAVLVIAGLFSFIEVLINNVNDYGSKTKNE